MHKKKAETHGEINGKKHKLTKPGKKMKVGEMIQGKKAEKGFKHPPKIVRMK